MNHWIVMNWWMHWLLMIHVSCELWFAIILAERSWMNCWWTDCELIVKLMMNWLWIVYFYKSVVFCFTFGENNWLWITELWWTDEWTDWNWFMYVVSCDYWLLSTKLLIVLAERSWMKWWWTDCELIVYNYWMNCDELIVVLYN